MVTQHFLKGFEKRAMEKDAFMSNLVGRGIRAAKNLAGSSVNLAGNAVRSAGSAAVAASKGITDAAQAAGKSISNAARMGKINYQRGLQGKGAVNFTNRPKVPQGGVTGPSPRGASSQPKAPKPSTALTVVNKPNPGSQQKLPAKQPEVAQSATKEKPDYASMAKKVAPYALAAGGAYVFGKHRGKKEEEESARKYR